MIRASSKHGQHELHTREQAPYLAEALAIQQEDLLACQKMGDLGAELLPDWRICRLAGESLLRFGSASAAAS